MHRKLIALGALAAACASAPITPSADAPVEWRELTSAHFVVRTDAADAGALVRQLEVSYERVGAVLAARGVRADGGRISAIAFGSLAELHEVAPTDALAYQYREPLGGLEFAIAFGPRGTPPFLVAKEVARVLLLRSVPVQPRWFALGAPSYVAGAAWGPGASEGVHEAMRVRFRDARGSGIRVRDLLSDAPAAGGAWKLAWVMVEYLAQAHPDRFSELMRRLPADRDPARVFSDVFPEWSPDLVGGPELLDAALEAYVAAPIRARPFQARGPDEAFTSRAISRAEVLALRLVLPRSAPGGREAVDRARIAEASELLELVPAHPVALATLGNLGQRDALTAARLAIEHHPRSAYAWAVLGDALPVGSADRVAAMRKALELAPEAPVVLNNLAWDLFKQGRHDEALWLANRAVTVAPWNGAALDTQATILGELGYCTDALAAQRRALEATRDRASRQAQDFRARIAAFESRCGAAAGPARHVP